MIKRGPSHIKVNFAPVDIYKDYKNTFGEKAVSKKLYRKIVDSCNKEIMNKVIMESKEIVLPHSVGRLRVQKRKTFFFNVSDKKYMPKDWNASKKAGEWICHLNEHRMGHKYVFQWKRAHIRGAKSYKFVATRTDKRRLAMVLKTMPQIDYFE